MPNYQPNIHQLTLAIKKQSHLLSSSGLLGLIALGISSQAFSELTYSTYPVLAVEQYTPTAYDGYQVSDNSASYNNNTYNSYNSNNSYNSYGSNTAYDASKDYEAFNKSNNASFDNTSFDSTNFDNAYTPSNNDSLFSSTTDNSYGSFNANLDNSSSFSGEYGSFNANIDNNSFSSSDYDFYTPALNYPQGQEALFPMYAEYARLSDQVGSLDTSTVLNFVKRYPDTVLGEKLTADFAEAKARTSDYQAIQSVAPYIINADKSEACAVAIGDLPKNSRRLAEHKTKVWLNTLKQPSLCTQLASDLNDSRLVTNKDRKSRLLRMLRLRRASDIISLSSSLGTPIDSSQLQSMQYSASQFFDRFNNEPASQVNQYLYLFAISKLTDNDYRQAETQIINDIRKDNRRSRKLLSKQTRRMAYRTIAVERMNMNTTDGFDSEAVTWFRNSYGEPFNYEESEDYAMASIRFSQWKDLVNAIASMDKAHRKEDIWVYWLARGYEQLGYKNRARKLYKQVAKKHNYYAYLAKDKLGMAVNLSAMKKSSRNTKLPKITSQQRNKMLKNETFARAFALYNADDKKQANREWNWGVRQALRNQDFPLLLAAARHAHDLGWYGRSIYAMEMSKDDLNLFDVDVSYPMPRKSSVIRYSNSAGIDPAWAYGIMRQESRFDIGAKSHVGAGGLMQIMPDTAKYIARKLGESYSSSKVAQGDTNIRYGTWYMGDVLSGLENQPVLATAGYNAGPNRAKRWKPDYNSLSADQYVETIPFPETRDYVKRVMENSTVYGHLLGRPKKISQRMGVIQP